MRWPWRRGEKKTNGSREAARAKAEAQGALRATKSFTRHVERMAPDLADLPAEEFTERVVKAFGRRRPA